MTDEVTPQIPKKDDKKPSQGTGRGQKRAPSYSKPAGAQAAGQGNPRPASRGSNKKSAGPSATESGSESASRKTEGARKPDPRNRNQGGARTQSNRKPSNAGRGGSSRDQSSAKSSPAPVQSNEASDALSSLQRVIADLKTISPQPPTNSSNNFGMSSSQGLSSNLPVNAPVFQPSGTAFPTIGNNDPKHRKAASLGTSALSGNFNSFSPHLGAMMEDAEDGGMPMEEGEIQEPYYPTPGHQQRSQSQSFTAPRFAALAQQDQGDSIGPTGRPQLAPNFMFGAKKRSIGSMGPPINEDVGFQFPQQQQNFVSEVSPLESGHRKSDSGEITGIMAEQVLLTLLDVT